ncbi:transglutaminase domain-containing protein [Lachnospiraceae bacterium 46-15]
MDVNKTWKRKIIAALGAAFAGALVFMPFGTAKAGLSEEMPVFESGVRLEAPSEGAEGLLESRPQKKFAYTERAGESFEDYLVSQLYQRQAQINVSSYGITVDAMQDVFYTMLHQHPELYFVSTRLSYSYNPVNGNVTILTVRYLEKTQEEQEQNQAKLQEETAKLLALIDEDMTDLEKVIIVHDYLCLDVEYAYADLQNDTLSDDAHTLKGAVIDKVAVCDGYSNAFTYYMQLLGIPCRMVTGTARGDHAWNQVELEGKWYLVDLTWDDAVWDDYGYAGHEYFLKDAEYFRQTHAWETSGLEACDDAFYNESFWNDTDAQMIYHEGGMYFIRNDGKLYRHDFAEDEITEPGTLVAEIGGRWGVVGNENAFYRGNYVKLAARGKELYYSMPEGIFTCGFDGNGQKQFLTADTSQGYVYGMKLAGDTLYYQIAQMAHAEERVTHASRIDADNSVEKAEITLSQSSFPYNGKEQYPVVTVKLDGLTLEENRDYKLTWSYPLGGVGTAAFAVSGIGDYEGTVVGTYQITEPEEGELPGDGETNPGGDGNKPGDGGTNPGGDGNKPGEDGSSPGGNETKPGEDGNQPGDSEINPGGSQPGGDAAQPGESVGRPNGNQTGGNTSGSGANTDSQVKPVSVKAPAKVKKLSVKASSPRKVRVSWKKQSCDGYRIQLSLQANFKKIAKTVTVRGGKSVKKTVSGLKAKKKYYVRIQAYRQVNGKRVYGTFSKKVKVRTK